MYERLLLQYLPCVTCLMGALLILLRRFEKPATKELVLVLLVAFVYWAMDVNYINPLLNTSLFFPAVIIGTVSALSVFPCMIIWQHRQMSFRSLQWFEYVFMFLPTFFFMASSVAMSLSVSGETFDRMLEIAYLDSRPVFDPGMDSLKGYYQINYTAFMFAVGTEIVITAGFFVHDIAMLIRLERRTVYETHVLYAFVSVVVLLVLALLRVCVGNIWLKEHAFLSSLISLCIAGCVFTCWYVLLLMGNKDERIAEEHASPAQVFSLKERFERLMVLDGWCYRANLKQEDITRELGVSYSYLRYMLNELYHLDYVSWVRQMRVRKAQDWMIKYPDMSMDEIAEQVGYSGAPALGKVFKEVTGYSPTAWRKNATKTSNK